MAVGILGFGGYTPDRIMTNSDWSQLVDTTDEWIQQRTGIRTRRIAADDQSTLDLAAVAAERAIADAGLTAEGIDEIIVATDTLEVYCPDTASYLQHRLGARQVPAFDLSGSGCAGFVLGIDIARARIQQTAKTVLVVGVELLTRLVDWKDRATAVLFGDGAGAVVMGSGRHQAELLAATSGTDGSRADILTLETGGTRRPFSIEEAKRGSHRNLVMNGREVFQSAPVPRSWLRSFCAPPRGEENRRRGPRHPSSGQSENHRGGSLEDGPSQGEGVRQRRRVRQHGLRLCAARSVAGPDGGHDPCR